MGATNETVSDQAPLSAPKPETDDSQVRKRKSPPPPEDNDELTKRARVSNEASPDLSPYSRRRSITNDHENSAPKLKEHFEEDRRKSATVEEKKRGRRLFGGILGNLGRTDSNNTQQQQRRKDIERKQQERLRKEKDEDDQKRTERLARMREARITSQITFDEQVMKHKHEKMLALARYLKTKAEPPVYYMPWKITQEEEDIINDQIAEARKQIDNEVEAFNSRKTGHGQEDKQRPGTSDQSELPPPTFPARDDEGNPHAEPLINSTETAPSAEATGPTRVQEKEHHDESGDVLVEADEDMVIY